VKTEKSIIQVILAEKVLKMINWIQRYLEKSKTKKANISGRALFSKPFQADCSEYN